MHIFTLRAGRVWAVLALAAVASRGAWASQVYWTGNGEDSLWDDPANWASLGLGYLPQPGDDAINTTTDEIFYQSTDSFTVNSFTTNGEFLMNGGVLTAGTPGVSTLEVDGTFAYEAGTLSGFVINKGAGSQPIQFFSNSTNFFDNMTSNVNLDLTLSGQLQITNGLTLGSSATAEVGNNGDLEFENSETLSGGTVAFSGASNFLNVEGANALTISGTLIHGSNATFGSQRYTFGANTIINDGIISADVNGGVFNLISNTFVNNGTLSAANGGTLNLNTNIANGSGNINVGSGSTVLVNNVTVTGGTINGPGALTFTGSSNSVLDSVTSNANFDMTAGTWVRIDNNLSLNAANSINLDNNARISFDNTQTFATGTINFGADSTQYLSVEGTTALTLGAGAIVQGANGILGYQFFAGGANTITNKGLISANTAGGLVTVQPSIFNNAGTARAINGGDLKLAIGSGTNSGTISVDANSSAQLSSSNALDNTGGNIVVNGIFTLNGGIIANGNISGSGSLTASGSSNNLLNGVAISAPIDLTNAGVLVLDNSTLSANASLDNSGRIYTEDQTTFASGTITLGADATQYISVEGVGTLTIDGHATIHGSEGVLGYQFVAGGANSIVNHGTINSDSSGGLIQIIGTNFSNDGITEATNGATLRINTTNSFNSGTLAANGISSVLTLMSTALDNTGGTISSSGGGSIFMNNAAISNGSITNTGGGSLTATDTSNNSLNNVAVSSPVDLSGGGRFVFNDSTLAANANLDNTAVIYVEGNSTFLSGTISLGVDGTQYISVEGTGTLTIDAPAIIHGSSSVLGYQFLIGGANSIVNHGTISSDSSGGTIGIVGNSFSNDGTAQATGGGTLNLNAIDSSNSHSLIASGTGSVLSLTTTLNNAGGTISATGGGVVRLSTASITGGAINSSSGGTITATNTSNNIIDDATVNAAVDLSTGGQFQLQDSIANFSSATMDNTAIIFVQGNDTLTGGTITFGGDGTQYIAAEGGSSLTIDPGVIIHGQSGIFGHQFLVAGSTNVTNQGDIDADVSGGTININYNSTLTNQGTLESKNGGTLTLNSPINNTGGNVKAGAGSTVKFLGITVTNGTLTGPGDLLFNNTSANVLDKVVVNGDLDLSSGGQFQIMDGITLNGNVNMDNTAVIFAGNNETITGGTINFGPDGTQYLSIESTNTLTLSATTLVHGTTGYIGYQFLANGANTLINHGTIYADGTGANFHIIASTFTNTGSVHAGAGNLITIANGETQTSGSSIVDGAITISTGGFSFSGGSIVGNGTFTVNGPMAWSGGTIFGNGLLTANNGLSITNSLVRSGQGLIKVAGGFTLNSGASLDLTQTDLIIDYTSIGISPVGTIAAELTSAYSHGSWNGVGIKSSAAGTGIAGTTLGYADNAVLGVSSFDSQPVNPDSVFVKYTWLGDANLDGKVNGTDLAMLMSGQSGHLAGWINGDFNYDGVVNSDDFALFMLGAARQTGTLMPAVPEPTVLGSVLLPFLHRRRKHS